MVLRSPAARIRCVAGSVLPMNADRSEMMRCAEPSGKPTLQLLSVEGWGLIQRAYMENAGVSPAFGVTRAAATVPIPLTAISSSRTSFVGPTCLNHSTSTRSESFTTIGQRLYGGSERSWYQSEFQRCEFQCSSGPVSMRPATSSGGLPASCSSATSASMFTSWRHGSCRLPTFQLTTVTGSRLPGPPFVIAAAPPPASPPSQPRCRRR